MGHALKILYHHRTRGDNVERVHILGMVVALENLGHRVFIAGPPGVKLEKKLTKNVTLKRRSGWTIELWRKLSSHCPEVFFEMMEIMYNFYSFFNLFRAFRKKRIDFIYERYALFSFSGVLFSKIRKAPIFIEVNDSALVERNRNLLFIALARKLEKWVFKRASCIVTVSGVFRSVISKLGIMENRIVVIPNAIDPNLFHVFPERQSSLRQELGLAGKIVIGYVGNFSIWHKLEFLIKGVAKVLDQGFDIHCILVGEGASTSAMKKLAFRIGIEQNFNFLGKKPHNEIAEYIALMDLCVLPSANHYCSPVKIFEYMAMGKAIVAPNLPNIREILTHGVDAMLFEPGDNDGFCKALFQLLENPGLREKVGNNARIKIYEKHLWKQNAKELIDLFLELQKNIA